MVAIGAAETAAETVEAELPPLPDASGALQGTLAAGLTRFTLLSTSVSRVRTATLNAEWIWLTAATTPATKDRL